MLTCRRLIINEGAEEAVRMWVRGGSYSTNNKITITQSYVIQVIIVRTKSVRLLNVKGQVDEPLSRLADLTLIVIG